MSSLPKGTSPVLIIPQATAVQNYQQFRASEWDWTHVSSKIPSKILSTLPSFAANSPIAVAESLIKEFISSSLQPSDVHYMLGQLLIGLDTSLPREILETSYSDLWRNFEKGGDMMNRKERMEAELGKRKVKWTAKKETFIARLPLALAGGFALIVPMLIMTLHESKLTSLLTTSVFVFAVAVALSWFMKDAYPKDIIGATAAYAAVLVVFVGTGGNSS
jgi:hypothetical protein